MRCKHGAALVATPVGAGDGEELEGSDLAGVLHVGTATEIGEGALRVGADDLVLGKLANQLELVGLILELLEGILARVISLRSKGELFFLEMRCIVFCQRLEVPLPLRGRGSSKS